MTTPTYGRQAHTDAGTLTLSDSELYDLDTRAAAYYTGKGDARRRQERRWCSEGACCRSWIGRAYTRGYDEVLAQRSAT